MKSNKAIPEDNTTFFKLTESVDPTYVMILPKGYIEIKKHNGKWEYTKYEATDAWNGASEEEIVLAMFGSYTKYTYTKITEEDFKEGIKE